MRRPALPTLVTLFAVAAAVGVVIWQFDPSVLLTNTITTGGDTGAHIATAAFLKSNLLPHLQLTGWDPQWYDGFPLYTFYFPLPDAIAAIASYVIPFNIAFKLATALGSFTLPVAAWAFGRLAGLERPRPAVLAVFTLPFLFDQSFTIYGGNIFSTMAGEYAYSLGLSVALVFLGLVVRGLRTGRHRAIVAVLLAACMLCHLVTAMFAIAGAAIAFLLLGPSLRRFWWLVTALGTGVLLVAWWAIPFVVDQAYTTDMGWMNVRTFMALFAPGGNIWALVLAGLGAIVALALRDRVALLLVLLGWAAFAATTLDPQGKLYNTRFLPLWWLCVYLVAGYFVAELGVGIARLWRWARLALWRASIAAGPALPDLRPTGLRADSLATAPTLGLAVAGGPSPVPSWSLPGTGTLAGAGTGTLAGAGTGTLAGAGGGTLAGPGVDTFGGARSEAGTRLDAGIPLEQDDSGDHDPAGPQGISGSSSHHLVPDGSGGRVPRPRFSPWAPGAVGVPLAALVVALAIVLPPLVPSWSTFMTTNTPIHPGLSSVPSWVRWNYSGYEAKPGWPEMEAVVNMASSAAKRYGCGRAMWEYNSNLDRFGTPMALMLLPMLTGGCVNTQEGLLFESASTTPYHFIDQSELSAQPDDAMVGLPYLPDPPQVHLGIEHLQLLGVKYFLASSPQVQAQADADPDVTLIDTSGPWHTEYSSQDVVTTWNLYLVHDSPVVAPLVNQPQVLEGVAASQNSWMPVALNWYDNPGAWDTELVAGGPPEWVRTTAKQAVGQAVPLPAVQVSDIREGADSVSFHVDRTGVPVVVRTSYFPAWHASGAQGPWRAEPNLMVVVPTSHDVTLNYGATTSQRAGELLSVIGLVALIVLIRRRTKFGVAGAKKGTPI
ncbi:MAG TPA: 6-pyruvoyl-tetrahydropterin synthase-related protein [Acidimicrobiales bacterium]|nr:6-pyruvoyl-tetrahydropterin synthase-related protein [Acidimicrobiales bacterium]